MNEIFRFLKANEVWIYVLLGLVGLISLRKFILALREWQGTIFGLERDNAQRRLNESASVLIILILIGAGEFLFNSFVFSTIPDVQVLATETLTVLTTPTVTLQVASGLKPTEQLSVSFTQAPAANLPTNGCVTGKFEFTFPKPTDEVSGIVEIKGSVNLPNLGFYKYEYTQPGSKTWITIAAGNGNKVNEIIGNWDTSQLLPGDYLLHLVAFDNKGQQLPPCETLVKIANIATP
jgi:hypothetical protein